MRAVIQAVSSASVRVNGGEPRAIGPGLVIGLRDGHRISGIFQINKIHAFYYTSFIYVQTWDNSFCKHDYASFPVPDSSAAKFSRIFKPHRLLFSGWN